MKGMRWVEEGIMEKKRYRNGKIWNFEMAREAGGGEVILGLDGGTTTTVCVCIPAAAPLSGRAGEPLPILARAVAGCSNHNSVGGGTSCWCSSVGLEFCYG